MKTATAKLLLAGGKDAALLEAMADICQRPLRISSIGGVDMVCLGSDYERIGAITPKARYNGKGTHPYGSLVVDYQDICHEDGTKEMIRVYIGMVGYGPIMMADSKGWSNLYSHGNCGCNYGSGGTWYAASGIRYASIMEALDNRHNTEASSSPIHADIVAADIVRVSAIKAML